MPTGTPLVMAMVREGLTTIIWQNIASPVVSMRFSPMKRRITPVGIRVFAATVLQTGVTGPAVPDSPIAISARRMWRRTSAMAGSGEFAATAQQITD